MAAPFNLSGFRTAGVLCAALALTAACTESRLQENQAFTSQEVEDGIVVRYLEDLVSSGLGLAGMQGAAPGFEDPLAPTALELRRGALYTNYRTLIDVTEGSGYGTRYSMLSPVPGYEVLRWRTIDGAKHPHGVAVLIPDTFNTVAPCLVVVPASATRGVYGGAGVAGDWALQRGCAVAYTDKGGGTGFVDLDMGTAYAVTGEVVPQSPGFDIQKPDGLASNRIAVKHAHSQDNPEALWGKMVIDAAKSGLEELLKRHPDLDDVTVVAAGISNGGAAVLHAAEADRDGVLDAVVSGEPNVFAPNVDAPVSTPEGRYLASEARAFLDYATLAGLLQPCAALHVTQSHHPFADRLDARRNSFIDHCAVLAERGLIDGDSADTRAQAAAVAMDALSFTDSALSLTFMNADFGIWQQTVITMASALGRRAVGEPYCGVDFAFVNEAGNARPATDGERATLFARSTGMVPTAGIVHVDGEGRRIEAGAAMAKTFLCYHQWWTAPDPVLRQSLKEIRSTGDLPDIPVAIVHGRADSLIPVNHSSRPYAAVVRLGGADQVRLYEIEHAQHVDAILAHPTVRDKLVWMQPYFWDALDRVFKHLTDGVPMPPSHVVRTQPGVTPAMGRLLTEPPSQDLIVVVDGVFTVPE